MLTEREIQSLARFTATRFLNRQSAAWRRDHAEDVRQLAWIETWRFAQRFDPARGKATTYLVRYVTGRLQNYRRDELRRNPPMLPLDALLTDTPGEYSDRWGELLADPCDLEAEALDRAEAEWVTEGFLRHLDAFTERQQMAMLAALSGMTGSEAARHLGVTATAASMCRKRAYSRLREVLEVAG